MTEAAEEELTGHPNSWVGKLFKSRHTGYEYKVLKVEKNHSRYSVKLDSDNDFMRHLGYDSRNFRKNWILILGTN